MGLPEVARFSAMPLEDMSVATHMTVPARERSLTVMLTGILLVIRLSRGRDVVPLMPTLYYSV